MNTKKLKQLVLDLAIHGKLVPQDPNDEPASVLLERIKTEKSKTLKGKKTTISSDNLNDVPFEVPEGWVWCRLGDISVDSADGPFGSNLKKEHYTDKQEVRIVQLSNIGELNWRDDNVKYTTFEHLKVISRSEVFPGDIIIAKMMPAGRAIICPSKERKYVLSSDAVKFSFSNLVYNKYLFYSINSSVFKEQVYDNVQGVTRVRTSLVKLREYLIPLPPLSEQKRIVAKIEKWFGIIDQLESNEADLRKSIEQTKKKVLDLAIHGKLVPQDPNDEPASELLKRIVETHGRASNIGRASNKKSAISSEEIDEVPFEVPEGWVWTNLKSICCKLVDGDHNPPVGEKEPTKYLMASSKNINNDKLVDLDDVRFLSENCFRECDKRTKVSIGDIAITSVGTLGRTCIIKEKINLTFQRSVTVLSLIFVDNRYVKYVLDSSYIQKFMLENSRGTAQQGFYINQMEELLIPLPPLSEQRRIVAKIEEVFGELDRIEEMIG